MKYKVSDILRDVRVILDQNSISEQLLSTDDVDTLAINEIIRSKILDAARFLITSAPLHLIGSGVPFADISVVWNVARGIGSGYALLPDDFLRLVSFQMSDWVRPVNKVITEDSPLYARQQSKFSGVRGNVQKPVVALVNHPAGLMLEFYSCKGGDNVYVKSMRYVPMPYFYDGEQCMKNSDGKLIDEKGNLIPEGCDGIPHKMIDLPDRLYDAIKYYTAYLSAATLEMPSAATLAEITKTYLQ